MFFPKLTPEIVSQIYKKPNFEEYYKQRYSEIMKPFYENPKISIKSMMVLSHIQNGLKERLRKEYEEKFSKGAYGK